MEKEHLFNDIELLFAVVSGHASAAINRRLYHDFRVNNIALTPEQWLLLQYLSFKDGISQQELAALTFKDRPTITRMLDNLERDKYITRVVDVKDKRSNLIHLTTEGLAIHKKAMSIIIKTMQDALAGITDDEIKQGERLLKQIYKNLE
jgi:MarR family transcriptional regulator, organic hydroperoxide resistance regulator